MKSYNCSVVVRREGKQKALQCPSGHSFRPMGEWIIIALGALVAITLMVMMMTALR